MTLSKRTDRKKGKRKLKGKKSRKVKLLLLFSVFIITSLILFAKIGTTIKACVNMYQYTDNELIYPNIFVGEENLGGKTKSEALKALTSRYKLKDKNRKLIIKVEDREYTLSFLQLNMKYGFKQAIDQAFKYGREDNFIKKVQTLKEDKKYKIPLKYEYDKQAIEKTIKDIEEKVNVDPVEATIEISSYGKFMTNEEQAGVSLNADKLKKDIDDNMNIDKNKNIIVKGELKEVKPKIKSEDLKYIDSKITSYTTSFDTSGENRINNIELAAKAIDGTIIMPQDSFSFNEVVGERTAEKGYKAAKVIINDEFIDDLGGGICQVSSTLYNAVTRANILPTERVHHTIASSYVPLGMDATVDYGNIDYKFTNTLPYAIYIQALINNKNITFNVYSNSSLLNRKYDLINEISGKKVRVYKVTYEDGKEIDKQLISSDLYNK